jgi:N-acetylmuramoyl-L-alanine amidase
MIMKRLLPVSVIALLVITSIVLAQSPGQATLRTPSGDRPLTITRDKGQVLFSAEEVMAALGGTLTPDSTGFKVTLNNATAAFGPDSRFAVVRDELIEMPVAPAAIDGKPFVAWQFFEGFLSRAADQQVTWDPVKRVLQVSPEQHNVITAQLSLANVQGISKIVVTFSTPVDYAIVKDPGGYTIHFKSPIRPPYAEQTHDDPNVTRTVFTANDLLIQLKSPDVAGDAYRLDNPFRIVLDLRKGAAAPGTTVVPPSVSKLTERPGIHTIVIDPGHGGKDVGAIGAAGSLEKEATLDLCRRLSAALATKTGARVVLTREDDSLVSLDQRTALANQYHADLFLSVHMNAAVVKGARGSETYFLSADASDDLAKKAADIENESARAAVPPTATSNDLKLILWDLAQQEYLQESSRLASDIQAEMNAISGVQGRGVKQAPFKVLVGATMPAALVEVAFISNPEEETRLKDEKFVATVVDALARAVVRYKIDYETRIGVIQPAPPAAKPGPAAPGPPAPVTATTTKAGP